MGKVKINAAGIAKLEREMAARFDKVRSQAAEATAGLERDAAISEVRRRYASAGIPVPDDQIAGTIGR